MKYLLLGAFCLYEVRDYKFTFHIQRTLLNPIYLKKKLIVILGFFKLNNKKTNGHPPEAILQALDTAKRLCDELEHNPWGDAYRQTLQGIKPKKAALTPANPEAIIQKLLPTHEPVIFSETSDEGLEDFTAEEVIDAAKKLKDRQKWLKWRLSTSRKESAG